MAYLYHAFYRRGGTGRRSRYPYLLLSRRAGIDNGLYIENSFSTSSHGCYFRLLHGRSKGSADKHAQEHMENSRGSFGTWFHCCRVQCAWDPFEPAYAPLRLAKSLRFAKYPMAGCKLLATEGSATGNTCRTPRSNLWLYDPDRPSDSSAL